MISEELRKKISNPEILRLQQVADGLKVGVMLGKRLLVEPVVPSTKIDELEKSGLLYAPSKAKEDNTPRPSTGIVLMVGNLCPKDGAWAHLQPGAMILFNKFAPMAIAIDKRDLLIVGLDDIACTLEATDDGLSSLIAEAEVRGPDVPIQAGVPILR